MWDAIIGTIEATPALAFAIGALLSGLAVSVTVVLWGAAHGKYITNLSLDLEIKRTPTANNAKHDLLTIIKIEKGPVNALTLETVKVELFLITDGELTEEMARWYKLPPHHAGERRPHDVWTPLPSATELILNRSLNHAGKRYAERRVLAFWTPGVRRLETLAPSDRTQYAGYATVDSTNVYEVIVTVIGIRYQSYPVRLCWRMISLGHYRPTRAYYTASLITVPADALPQAIQTPDPK